MDYSFFIGLSHNMNGHHLRAKNNKKMGGPKWNLGFALSYLHIFHVGVLYIFLNATCIFFYSYNLCSMKEIENFIPHFYK